MTVLFFPTLNFRCVSENCFSSVIGFSKLQRGFWLTLIKVYYFMRGRFSELIESETERGRFASNY